jgi:hypothetical protein
MPVTKEIVWPKDLLAEFVWPPPPDKPRIKLEAVWSGRADVEAESKLRKALIGAGPQTPYDRLGKPFAVAFDPQGRVLVSDSRTAAVVRFDDKGRKYDVIGTQGAVRLKVPLGLGVAPDGTIFVADGGQEKVLAFTPEGSLKAVYGKAGELVNPTDAAVSPDGASLFVADSKAHKIVASMSPRHCCGAGRAGSGDAAELPTPPSSARTRTCTWSTSPTRDPGLSLTASLPMLGKLGSAFQLRAA